MDCCFLKNAQNDINRFHGIIQESPSEADARLPAESKLASAPDLSAATMPVATFYPPSFIHSL